VGRPTEAIGLYERNPTDAERLGAPDYSQAVIARDNLAAVRTVDGRVSTDHNDQ
jgi:hypothetical protein